MKNKFYSRLQQTLFVILVKSLFANFESIFANFESIFQFYIELEDLGPLGPEFQVAARLSLM